MKRLLILPILMATVAFAQAPFSKGVNLTGWFQKSGVRHVQFTHFTKQDFINIKSLGCDVVRLPINLVGMGNGAPDYTLDPLFFYFLDQVIDWAEELDMHLMLDYHATETAVFTDPNLEMSLVKMWSQMAERYKDRSTRIFYEIINEPHDITDSKWNNIQKNVIAAIRAIDQKHTIVVTPAGWGSYNNLKNMPVYADSNLIYSFHFYDPFLFTHQGASWTSPSMASLAGVPFPYDATRMPACPADLKGTWIEGSLANSYKTDGTEKKVKELINIAIKFRTDRNVPIFCGEFGVYMANNDNEDRVRWYGIVPGYLAENNIPWTMWDYEGGFGIFEKGSSNLFEYDVNVPLIAAMGLTPPEQKEFVLSPDTVGFDLYTDFVGPRLQDGSWGSGGSIDYYNEDAVIGRYCVQMSEVAQYSAVALNFRPIKDLSALVEKGYALDFWLKSDNETMRIDLRFVDTKTAEPDDHPWRMKVTIDKNLGQWDGEWKHLQIPLENFVEGGSWDNAWYNPQGDYDWTHVDKIEIVSEHHAFTGMSLWVDNLRIVDPAVVGVNDQLELPRAFVLEQNYPNPFNPTTTIGYEIPAAGNVELAIFNAMGQHVRTLVNKEETAGRHSLQWDGLDNSGQPVSSGVFLYRLKAENFIQTRKMILIR